MPKTKNASGYYVADDMDAIDLFIGACGTLGVITELEIALQPASAVVWGVSCFFDSEDKAVAFTDSVRPVLSHAAAIEYFDAGALDILRRQREQSTAFASLPALDDEAKVCVYVELDCDDEAQATEELYHLDGFGACGRPRRRDMGCAHRGRSRVPAVLPPRGSRERQHAHRRASPHGPHHYQAGFGYVGAQCTSGRCRRLYRRTLAESGLESAPGGISATTICM